ncbi:MAG: ABC transporter substrate-binding protein [Bauldia sp.]|nr:ABC transporter substrate-binding protein [Bauldia sp.]
MSGDILKARLSRRSFIGSAALGATALAAFPRLAFGQDAVAPVHGGTLTVNIGVEPPALVNLATSSGSGVYVTGKVTEGLLTYDFDLNPRPELATSWSLSSDGLVYTFQLRPGVKWHDGRDFTSADVAFSILTLKEVHPRGRTTFANVVEVREVSPTEVQIVLSQPAPYLISALAASESPIVPKHVYEGGPAPDAHPNAAAPIGTGPFVFREWVRGSHLILERNPDYWDAPKPYLDRLIVRFIGDAAAGAVALETGEVQLATGAVSLSDVERLRALPHLGFETRGYSYVNAVSRIEFNLDNPFLGNLLVRKAIAHSIDKSFINDTIFLGYGQIIPGPISPWLTRFYVPDLPTYAFDTARANALLDEAGFPRNANGVRFSLNHDPLPGGDPYRRTGEYLRQALRDVGIDVTIRSQDFAAYVTRVYTDRDFDFTFNGMSNLFDPTVGVQRLYWSQNFRPGVPFSNGSHYSNPEVDRLLEAAAVEVDPEVRLQQFDAFQRIIVDELPDIGINAPDAFTIFDRRVHNHTIGADGFGNNGAEIFITA